MKARTLLAILALALCQNTQSQLDLFENADYCHDNTSVIEMLNNADGFLEMRHCHSAYFSQNMISQYNLDGSWNWSVYPFMFQDDFSLSGEGNLWVLEVDNGCDYIGFMFRIMGYDSTTGELNFEFASETFEEQPHGPEQLGFFTNRICWVNDDLIVIGSEEKLSFFNPQTEVFENSLNVDFVWGWKDIFKVDDTTFCAYTSDSLFTVNASNAEVIASFNPEWEVTQAVMVADHIVVVEEFAIRLLDSNLEEVATYSGSSFYRIIDIVDNNLYVLSGLGIPENLLILDQDLSLIDTMEIPESDRYYLNEGIVSEDMIILSGTSGIYGTKLVVHKAHDTELSAADYSNDIALTDIEVGGIMLDYVGFGDYYYLYATDVELDVQNTGDSEVTYFTQHTQEGGPGYCGTPYNSQEVDATIAPGASYTSYFGQSYVGDVENPQPGELMTFEICHWINGPNEKIDDDQSDNQLCETFEFLVTEIVFPSLEDLSVFWNQSTLSVTLSRIMSINSWALYDTTGRLIMNSESLQMTDQIYVGDLEAGHYVFSMESGGQMENLKFILE